MTDSRILAEKIAEAAYEKKGRDIVFLHLRQISIITDYFLLVTGNSTTQVKAIADNITKELKEDGIIPSSKEGYKDGQWILLDYGNVVVHIFLEEQRRFYDLERLWGDADTDYFNAE